MIVETRYRDITSEELDELHPRSLFSNDGIDWESIRGKPVRIITPALPDRDACGGPFYWIEGRQGTAWVCPHLAEIGD